MESFNGKLAVVTGGGSGMGRQLVVQLAGEGCSVATCDLNPDSLASTKSIADAAAPAGTRISTHTCDVSDETAVKRLADEVATQHDADHVDLLFNNAGIAGAGSFVTDERSSWERVFGICWFGVYYTTRAFMPLLRRSEAACIINTSSANGFWATHGPGAPSTAYATAKFAVKGFSEALIEDLRTNAPNVKVAVVMPGTIGGTAIGLNSARVLGRNAIGGGPEGMRAMLESYGLPVTDASEHELERIAATLGELVGKLGTTAGEAAATILDGVRHGRWRIVVGADAQRLDQAVRADPEAAYDRDFPGLTGSPWLVPLLVLSVLFEQHADSELAATYELRGGDEQIAISIVDRQLSVERGPSRSPDATLDLDPQTFRALLTGEQTLDGAISSGALKLGGARQKAEWLLAAVGTPTNG